MSLQQRNRHGWSVLLPGVLLALFTLSVGERLFGAVGGPTAADRNRAL